MKQIGDQRLDQFSSDRPKIRSRTVGHLMLSRPLLRVLEAWAAGYAQGLPAALPHAVTAFQAGCWCCTASQPSGTSLQQLTSNNTTVNSTGSNGRHQQQMVLHSLCLLQQSAQQHDVQWPSMSHGHIQQWIMRTHTLSGVLQTARRAYADSGALLHVCQGCVEHSGLHVLCSIVVWALGTTAPGMPRHGQTT